MTTRNTAIELLKSLIQIPSYIDHEKNINETKLVEYIQNWSKHNLNCQIEKQDLGNNRYNLILKKGKPETIFLAHTDTVVPTNDKQLQAIVKNGEIWGRGATDMKSGLAALLLAAKNNDSANNYWIVLYADEEYDFLGMTKFLQEYPDLTPKKIISADGSDLQIGYACRGLIELRLRVMGKSGHAAKGNGVNAITATYNILRKIEKSLKSFPATALGSTSVNLAYILGGQNQKSSKQTQTLQTVGQAGNVIPDICEFVIDIRPSNPEINAKWVIKNFQQNAKVYDVNCEILKVTHDYSAWITKKSDILSTFAPISKPNWSNPQSTGYIDLQMMWQRYGKPPAFTFGGGLGNTAHSAEERIIIKDYMKSVEFFSTLMEEVCK